MYDKTPKEILHKFYVDNNLDIDGGQNSSSVKIEVTKQFHFYFPNFDARRKAVIKHDIHHLVTGYSASSIAGESEISAWEIASGCKSYWAAFLIDTSGVMIGIPINFFGVLKAFARGRRTKNLYHDQFSTETAMEMSLDKLRELLLLDVHPINTKVTVKDVILFSVFVFFGLIYSLVSLILLPFIIMYTIFCWLTK